MPEILKKSLHSCSVRGGEEVFIIGKNFLKGTKVIFQENIAGVSIFPFYSCGVLCVNTLVNGRIKTSLLFIDENSWQAEAKIDMDLFHQVNVTELHEYSYVSS